MKVKLVRESLNEVTDEYISQKTQQARQQGRNVSPEYEKSLKDKNAKNPKPVQKTETIGVNTFILALKNYVQQKQIPWEVNLWSNGMIYLTKQEGNRSTGEMIVYQSQADHLIYYNEQGKSVPLSNINNVISLATFSKLIQQSFPNSKYADRKIWSSL